jgi:hypothetical protein
MSILEPDSEEARKAKKRENSKRYREKLKSDLVRLQANRDRMREHKRKRRQEDPNYREKHKARVKESVRRRKSANGGDPKYREQVLSYQRQYNSLYYEKKKQDPQWIEMRNQQRRNSDRARREAAKGAKNGPDLPPALPEH